MQHLSKRQQRLAAMPPMPAGKNDISIYYRPKVKVKKILIKRIRVENSVIDPALTKSPRRAQVSIATPSWANSELMKMFYTVAQQISKNTGIPHHVDHIVPISHPLVCGLHNEHNMQILTDSENCSKSNKFDI